MSKKMKVCVIMLNSTVWNKQMCNPRKSSIAELFSAISSWDWAQNEGWTFVLQDHIKKVSQFSVVRSVSAIILDHSEMPSALHQNIPWVNRRLLVCHKVQCDLSKKYKFRFMRKPDYLPDLHYLPVLFKNFKARNNLWLKSNLLMPKTLL